MVKGIIVIHQLSGIWKGGNIVMRKLITILIVTFTVALVGVFVVFNGVSEAKGPIILKMYICLHLFFSIL